MKQMISKKLNYAFFGIGLFCLSFITLGRSLKTTTTTTTTVAQNYIASITYTETEAVDYFYSSDLDLMELHDFDFTKLRPSNITNHRKIGKTSVGQIETSSTFVEAENVFPKWFTPPALSLEDPFETRQYNEEGELINTLQKDDPDDPAEEAADFDDFCNGGDFLDPLTEDEIQELVNNGITVNIYENHTELIIPVDEGVPTRVLWNDTYMETWETITTDAYDIATYEKVQQSDNGHLLLVESREVQRLSLRTDHCIERHRIIQRENYILEGECETTIMESNTITGQIEIADAVEQMPTIYPTLLDENAPITITGLSPDSDIQIINIYGQEVYNVRPKKAAINIPTHNIAPGVYFVKVRKGKQLSVTQIQKH